MKQILSLHFISLPMASFNNMQIINISQITTDCFAFLGSARNDLANGFVEEKEFGEAALFLLPSLMFQAVIAMEERLKQSVDNSLCPIKIGKVLRAIVNYVFSGFYSNLIRH